MNKQGIFEKIFKLKQEALVLTKDTKAFNYSYATLKQIQELLGPKLVKSNLVIIHKVVNNEVVTQIIDIEDGSFIESSIGIGEVKTTRKERFIDNKGKDIEVIDNNTMDPQGVGSIITYYRRYNLLALLDLEQEDDDGTSGSNRAKAKVYEVQKKPNFTKEAFTKFKEVEDFTDHFKAYALIEKKYTLGIELRKEIKTYFENKIDKKQKESIGTEGNPPF